MAWHPELCQLPVRRLDQQVLVPPAHTEWHVPLYWKYIFCNSRNTRFSTPYIFVQPICGLKCHQRSSPFVRICFLGVETHGLICSRLPDLYGISFNLSTSASPLNIDESALTLRRSSSSCASKDFCSVTVATASPYSFWIFFSWSTSQTGKVKTTDVRTTNWFILLWMCFL